MDKLVRAIEGEDHRAIKQFFLEAVKERRRVNDGVRETLRIQNINDCDLLPGFCPGLWFSPLYDGIIVSKRCNERSRSDNFLCPYHWNLENTPEVDLLAFNYLIPCRHGILTGHPCDRLHVNYITCLCPDHSCPQIVEIQATSFDEHGAPYRDTVQTSCGREKEKNQRSCSFCEK
jgi:hypothetical protein